MHRLICRLFGHDRMMSGAAHRICLRCGLREALRNYGHVRGWEEVTATAGRGSSVHRSFPPPAA
jgi:hypothetical protein